MKPLNTDKAQEAIPIATSHGRKAVPTIIQAAPANKLIMLPYIPFI